MRPWRQIPTAALRRDVKRCRRISKPSDWNQAAAARVPGVSLPRFEEEVADARFTSRCPWGFVRDPVRRISTGRRTSRRESGAKSRIDAGATRFCLRRMVASPGRPARRLCGLRRARPGRAERRARRASTRRNGHRHRQWPQRPRRSNLESHYAGLQLEPSAIRSVPRPPLCCDNPPRPRTDFICFAPSHICYRSNVKLDVDCAPIICY
jgi:hypothetical protein